MAQQVMNLLVRAVNINHHIWLWNFSLLGLYYYHLNINTTSAQRELAEPSMECEKLPGEGPVLDAGT